MAEFFIAIRDYNVLSFLGKCKVESCSLFNCSATPGFVTNEAGLNRVQQDPS